MNRENIKDRIKASISTKEAILESEEILNQIETIAKKMVQTYQNDGKILFCGNGGSAGDAQHIAAELSGRYYFDRPPLNAEALHVNSSYLTAVGNDYGFDFVYERMTEALGKKGDILVGISTSGNSTNVNKALIKAKELGILTVGLSGRNGGKMKNLCDFNIIVPSDDTPRIQESHILIGHILCEWIEVNLFKKNNEK